MAIDHLLELEAQCPEVIDLCLKCIYSFFGLIVFYFNILYLSASLLQYLLHLSPLISNFFLPMLYLADFLSDPVPLLFKASDPLLHRDTFSLLKAQLFLKRLIYNLKEVTVIAAKCMPFHVSCELKQTNEAIVKLSFFLV